MLTVDGMAVEVTRKRIKNMYLRIDAIDGHIRVSCPMWAGDAEVTAFVRSKRLWLEKHRARIDDRSASRLRECVSGEELYLWGRTLPLEVVPGNRFKLDADGDAAILTAPPTSSAEGRRTWLRNWYKKQVEQVCAGSVPAQEIRMQLKCSGVTVRWMKSRWGSCSVESKTIRINSQLAKFPRECLEYVIIHELAHIAVPNHGPAFQALMDKYCPDWHRIRRMLNERDFAFYE
ncbi:MAG: M48 family metallopeptidase [Atopobiaceae bacterium]|nr:M48 family metallopeptidase [Atopobiaceae bacterium]